MGAKKVFELMLEIGHKSQPLKNKLPNGYTHKWTVFVRGADNAKVEHCIQRVVFQLHDSFPNPHREITEPPFQVKETGYAGFEIPIEIYFKNRDKPNHLVFVLDLCLLTGRPNSAIKNHKVSFHHPNRDFEKCLIKTGAQMNKVKKERSDSPPAKKQKSSSLIPSKDMSKQTPQTQNHSQIAVNAINHNQTSSTSSSHHSNSHHHHNHHHHHKSAHHNHQHSHHGHNSNTTNHAIGSNNGSNNHFQNHHGNHQSNHTNHNHHSSAKSSSHQSSSSQKPKTTSKEFLDVFGAPLVVNNSNNTGGCGGNGGKSHKSNSARDTVDGIGDVEFSINESLPPPLPRIANKPAQASATHVHSGSKSNQSRSNPKQQQVKSEPPQVPQQSPILPTQSTTQPTPQSQQTIPQDPFQTIQEKISALTDCDRLQKIVDIIEESGEWYNLTANKFEFDLKRLDKKILYKIEKCLNL